MIVINNIDGQKFSYNGVNYYKNFTPVVVGSDKIRILNTYDSKIELTKFPTLFSEITLNGVVYGSLQLLQDALLPVVFTRNSLGGESESSIKTQINNGYEFFCDFNQSFSNNQVISGELTVSATGGGGNNLQAGIIGTEYQDVLSMIMQTSATSRVFTQSGGSFISGAFEFSTLIIPQTACTLTEKYRLITGLGVTQADSDQSHGIYFLYDKYGEGNVGVASDNYLCVCKNGANISVVDSGVPYQSLVGRKLGFVKNSNGTEVTFSIDNLTVATITTNIPSVSMRVMNVCEKYLGTGSAIVSFDYIYYKNFKNRI